MSKIEEAEVIDIRNFIPAQTGGTRRLGDTRPMKAGTSMVHEDGVAFSANASPEDRDALYAALTRKG